MECVADLTKEELNNRFVSKIMAGKKVMANGSQIDTQKLWKIKVCQSEESIEKYIESAKHKLSKIKSILRPSTLSVAIDLCQDITNTILTEPVVEDNPNGKFVNPTRIKQLSEIDNQNFDLRKLIRLLEELNSNYEHGCIYSTSMILRAVLDHVPPIWRKSSFGELVSQVGGKSFKDSMSHLEKGLRKISDGHLHSHIRKKEVLPVVQQVEFRPQLDLLLSELLNILS